MRPNTQLAINVVALPLLAVFFTFAPCILSGYVVTFWHYVFAWLATMTAFCLLGFGVRRELARARAEREAGADNAYDVAADVARRVLTESRGAGAAAQAALRSAPVRQASSD